MVKLKELGNRALSAVQMALDFALTPVCYALYGRVANVEKKENDERNVYVYSVFTGPNERTRRLEFYPVLLWLISLLTLLIWVPSMFEKGKGNGNVEKEYLLLLNGDEATPSLSGDAYKLKGNGALSKTPWCVLGFNIIQVIALASAGIWIKLREMALGREEGMLKRIVGALATLVAVGIDAVFVAGSLGAILYSGLAYNKGRLAPNNGSDDASADARWHTITILVLFVFNVLAFLEFRERDKGKCIRTPEELGIANEKKDEKEDEQPAALEVEREETFLKGNLNIHSYY